MVEVYSSDSCIWCRRMKQYLDSKGVDFRTLDVSDPDNARRVLSLTGQRAVPVTVIGKTAVVGFDTEAVDRALQSM